MKALAAFWMFAAAGLVLFVADHWLQPVPVAAVTAALGGVLGLLPGRGVCRYRLTAGVLTGLAVGATHHFWIHASERSPLPPEGIPAHLLAETAVGLAVAAVAVGIAALIKRRQQSRVNGENRVA